MLTVNATTLVKWIRAGRLPATQICPNAPWVLRPCDVESFATRLVEATVRHGVKSKQLALKIQ